jgi:hypothetical protein
VRKIGDQTAPAELITKEAFENPCRKSVYSLTNLYALGSVLVNLYSTAVEKKSSRKLLGFRCTGFSEIQRA